MWEPQFCLDWLTFTFPVGTLSGLATSGPDSDRSDIKLLTTAAKALLRDILGLGDQVTFRAAYPRYGMGLALQADIGATIHFCPSFESSLECVVVIPGSALVIVRTSQMSTRHLAQRANDHGARCSRLDVAIDVFSGSIETYIDDARDHQTGDIRRSATVISPLDDTNGTTLYVGSRKSSRFLRVYEKARQLRVDLGCPWIRIELEAKRKVARAMFAQYVNGGVLTLVSDIAARYQFKADVWNTLLQYATPGKEARRILIEGTQGKAKKSEWVLRHISAIANGIDEMTMSVFLTALASRASNEQLTGLMSDLITLV